MNDVAATEADFNGVSVGRTSLQLLALYWALAKYDPDIRGSENALPSIEPDDEDGEK